MTTVTLTWPTAQLVNLNAERKMHPKARNRLVQPIRAAAKAQAADATPTTGPVVITARFQWADEHRRDTSNWLPTVKAMVDGLVDAGVLPGDHDAIVHDTRIGADLPAQRGLKGYVRIALTITPAEATP